MTDLAGLLSEIQKQKQLRLQIKVLPRSSVNKIIEISVLPNRQYFLKIKLTAQPVEGKANLALVDFLHRQFKLPKYCFELVSGQTNKNKTVNVTLPA